MEALPTTVSEQNTRQQAHMPVHESYVIHSCPPHLSTTNIAFIISTAGCKTFSDKMGRSYRLSIGKKYFICCVVILFPASDELELFFLPHAVCDLSVRQSHSFIPPCSLGLKSDGEKYRAE